MTHDLMHSILRGFNAKPIQVVISDVQDTVYFARLYLEQTIDQKRTVPAGKNLDEQLDEEFRSQNRHVFLN